MLLARRFHVAVAAVLTSTLLAACGGGSSSTSMLAAPAPVPTASSAPVTSTQSAAIQFQLSQQPSTATLPAFGGYTSRVLFPGLSMSPEPTIGIEPSTFAPPGAPTPQNLRRTQSGTLTVFFFLTFTSPLTITLSSVPGFSLDLPATFPTAGEQFFVALSDPTVLPTVQFRTQGPATVSGHTVTFAPDGTPLTLVAGQKYVFAFYATSNTVAPAAARNVFVADTADNIFSFAADGAGGNIPAAHTFSGAGGSLNSLASGPAGDLFAVVPAKAKVLQLSSALALETTIQVPGIVAPHSVGVDNEGFIYTISDVVGVFAPGSSGTPKAFTRSFTMLANRDASSASIMGFDAADNLFIVALSALHDQVFVDVYAPGADSGALPINTLIVNVIGQFAFDFGSGKVDRDEHVYFTDRVGNRIVAFSLAGCLPGSFLAPSRIITGAQTLLNSPIALALDASGNIYVANAGSNTITKYPGTATGNTPPTMSVGGSNAGFSGTLKLIAVSP